MRTISSTVGAVCDRAFFKQIQRFAWSRKGRAVTEAVKKLTAGKRRMLQSANSPPNLGGVAAPSKKWSRSYEGAAGVVPNGNHPGCARLRWLRGIFLMDAATPPNLGGESR